MKRITQILASAVFVITVLTVYLAFDFAINNAISNKNSVHKRSLSNHDNPHDNIKLTKRRSVSPSLLSHTKKSNRTMHKQDNDHEHHPLDNDHRTRKSKQQQQAALRAKPGSFHKGKTGVKVNKPRKSIKEQRKRFTTTTTMLSQKKDKHQFDDK